MKYAIVTTRKAGAHRNANEESCHQILSHRLGDIVDSGMGCSYRPARLLRMAGQYDNPMPESTISPESVTKNLATGLTVICKF
jgi:hypothetical protein